jgi:hypothetical protein
MADCRLWQQTQSLPPVSMVSGKGAGAGFDNYYYNTDTNGEGGGKKL